MPSSTVNGCLMVDSSMVVMDSLGIMDNLNVGGDLNVTGNSVFTGTVTATQGIYFDAAQTNGIKLFGGGGNNTQILSLGGIGPPPMLNPCIAPSGPSFLVSVPSQMQIFNAVSNGSTYVPGGSILNMQSFINFSSIDAVGGQGGGSLGLNYFCGKDVNMCTGLNGGVVATGANFEVGFPTRNITLLQITDLRLFKMMN